MKKHSAFVKAGVFDGNMDVDIPMHVHPFLLKNCKEKEFENAYDEFLSYFSAIILLAKEVKVLSKTDDRCFKQLYELFKFKEMPNTGLGYAVQGGHGNGISGKLSLQLAKNAVEIVRSGMENPAIFSLLPLFEEGIGADRISDMTIAILRRRFYEFSARKAHELGLPTRFYTINAKTETIELPVYQGRQLVLIPDSILSDLPVASDPAEIEDVSSYNRDLRTIVCKAIGISWRDYEHMAKEDLKKSLLSDTARLEQILKQVSGMKFLPYDFSHDKSLVYLPVYVQENWIKAHKLDLIHPTEQNVIDVAMQLCTHFKKLIEVHRMSQLLFTDGKPQRESFVQRLFYMTSSMYCISNNIDMSREVDGGCGALDFKFSAGAHSKVIVEIKLSSSSQLIHGLTSQLPIYMEAENVQNGIYMVMRMSAKDDKNLKKLLQAYDKMPLGPSRPRLLVIDAVPRPSASKS